MDQKTRRALIEAAGKDNFSDWLGARLAHASDGTGRMHPPEAVVRGTGARQIGRVLAVCSEFGVPIVPRGAGSGQSGGALAVAGGVVLDMAGMDRIVRINRADQTAIVQPGVVTADLQRAAAAKDLFYPPDPASVEFCTLGGNAAENAGGLRAVKYGVTRDYVLALEAVLPTGKVIRTGSATMKGVVGYDLTRLLVGSEGTLAVITELTLRLLPLPEAEATLSAVFEDLDHAADAVAAVLASGIRPVALEFMDAASLRAVQAHGGLEIESGTQAMVLVEIDGPHEVVTRQGGLIEKLLLASKGRNVRLAFGGQQSQAIWRARKAMGPAMKLLAEGKFNEDIVVPLGRMAEMVRRVQDIAEKRDVLIVTFGHAGDGNLHVNVMYDPRDATSIANAEKAVSDVFANTLDLGGTISGEHGVGVAKLGASGAEIDPEALALMHGIKKVFDPAGVLNPRKAIPPLEALAR